MSDIETPSWGIEPVPERLRVLGFFDGFLLWANLSVSLLVIVAGAFLVLPADQFGLALSLPEAIGAIVAAAFVGNLLLGLGGLIGADARVPTMVLMRAPLGRRGSYLPTGLNIAAVPRLVGVRADRDRDRRERALAAGARLRRHRVLEDPVRRRRDGARVPRPGRLRAQVRPQVRGLDRDRVAALSHVVVAARPAPDRALAPARRARVLGRVSTSCSPRSSAGRRSSPTTRASRARARAGFWGAGLGYFVPTIPLFALGAVIAMSRSISEAPALLTAIAAGGAASILALLALTVDESDEAFANVYSGAVSLQNLLPRRAATAARRRVRRDGDASARCSSTCATTRRSSTCSARSSSRCSRCCSPTGCSRGGTTTRTTCSASRSSAPEMIAAWLAGFALYQWLSPVGPGWWTRLVAHTHPHALAVGRRVAAELRRRVRARHTRPGTRSVIALLGNLSRDVMPGRPPQVGGGPYHGARALQRLRVPARIVARCATADRDRLLPPLVRLGTPVRYVAGESTATFSFSYDGDRRTMTVDALGDTWRPARRARAALTLDPHRAALARANGPPRRWRRSRAATASRSTGRGSCVPRRPGRSCSTTTSTANCCATSGC